MGGNLLKTWNLPEKRLYKQEFEDLSLRLLKRLESKIPTKFNIIKYYKSKSSFGDLDISFIQEDKEHHNALLSFINQHSSNITINSNIYSFPFEGFQIDLIGLKKECFDIANIYYAYNDLGNLMGRIAHKMGFSYGHEGLCFKIREDLFDENVENPHVFSERVLSREPNKIFQFLGYDYNRFLQGFDTMDDIFNYVISGKYFNPNIFKLEELNHINKTRNRKRQTYRDFLEYLEWYKSEFSSMPLEFYQFKDKMLYLVDASKEFRLLSYWIEGDRDEFFLRKKRHSKFNGNIISKIIGVTGKDLGIFICNFKKQFSNFNEYLDSSDSIDIIKDIINFSTKNTDTQEVA